MDGTRDNMHKLAGFIGTRRRSLNISLRQLEASSGVSSSWLSKLESGKTVDLPKAGTLIALAAALQTTVVELLLAAGVDHALVLPPHDVLLALKGRA